jgi:nascent polypeptide-associated complex subunit beta
LYLFYPSTLYTHSISITMRSTLLLTLLPAAVSAHFHLNYPADRGDTDTTQDQSPCGGLNTPSKDRPKWPITGGQLSLEAGHDEANTAVYLALGDNPKAEDFTIILKDRFLQVGLGTFCWNDLPVPKSVSVKEGDNATIQVVQEGHTGGGLYNVCITPDGWGIEG